MTNVFAEINATYKAQVMEDTWGHLAPIKNKSYSGRIVYTIGCYGNTPVPIFCEFNGLNDSPWFFSAIQDFMFNQKTESGIVYEFIGTFKNYEFKGTIKPILSIQ
jgi:hypothetical protein